MPSEMTLRDILRNDYLMMITKRFPFLYGAGDEKVGTIVFGMVAKAKALGLDYQHLLDVFFNGQDNPDEEALKAAGKKLKATFLRKTPALKKLVKAVKEAAKRGHLVGLDGRHVHVKSAHAALYLLQGAGALACKQWLVFLDDELQARGLPRHWARGCQAAPGQVTHLGHCSGCLRQGRSLRRGSTGSGPCGPHPPRLGLRLQEPEGKAVDPVMNCASCANLASTEPNVCKGCGPFYNLWKPLFMSPSQKESSTLLALMEN